MTRSVSAAATIAVRHISAYLDLLRRDLDIGLGLGRSRLVAASVMAAALLIAVTLLGGWIVAEAWNTPQRLWVVGRAPGDPGRDCIHGILENPRPALAAEALSQTTRELSEDRTMLIAFLERDKDLQR
jgi:hypothetical protein